MPDKDNRYHVFETAAGFAAIAWNPVGISAVRLPAATRNEAERALLRRLPEASPAVPAGRIAEVIEMMKRYFAGEQVAFDDLPVDLGEQEPFFARVYDAVRKLGWGETTTYGAVAKALGAGPEAARDVGQAMANNPVPLIIPCHRVTKAGGAVGGFSAPGGSIAKARMLALEGVPVAEAAPAKSSPQTSFGF
jgi:methylated-DNA-[protein]-cysteine S-methyltransferase